MLAVIRENRMVGMRGAQQALAGTHSVVYIWILSWSESLVLPRLRAGFERVSRKIPAPAVMASNGFILADENMAGLGRLR